MPFVCLLMIHDSVPDEWVRSRTCTVRPEYPFSVRVKQLLSCLFVLGEDATG
jgi:hypothetical protein